LLARLFQKPTADPDDVDCRSCGHVLQVRLGRLEGAPHLFQLLPVHLQGFEYPSSAYLFQKNVSNFRDCGDKWIPKVRL
jgi:hypothetical protein